MTIDLRKMTSGKLKLGKRILIYGPEKVGKTTFAASSGRTRFLDLERGSADLDIKGRIMLDTWDEVVQWIDAIDAGETGEDYDSVVIDSATKLESLLHKHLLKDCGGTIEDFGGGYGRGATASVQQLRVLLEKLERLRAKGKNVIVTGHCVVKKFEDPSGPGWERYEIAAVPKYAGALKQWVDYTLFAQRETTVAKIDGKKKGTATGAHFIYTRWSAAYDAGSRGELPLPEMIPLSWSDFMAAVNGTEVRAIEMKRELDEMLGEIADADYANAAKGFLGANPTKLTEAHNRVTVRLAEVRRERTKEEKKAS